MKLKSIYRLALLGGVVAIAGCSGEEFAGASDEGIVPESVTVTLTVSRPGGASTRTQLEENVDGTLTSTWTTGDKLLVVTSDGGRAGELTLTEGAESQSGVFTGKLSIVDGTKASLWYLGAKNGTASPYTVEGEADGKVTLTMDLAALGAEFEDLKRAELLTYDNVVFTVKNSMGYVQTKGITLTQKMAMAHFTLTFPNEDFTLSEDARLRVNSENGDLPNKKSWLSATTAADATYGYTFTLGASDSDGKDIVVKDNKADLYIPIIPGSYKLKFDVTSDGKDYTYTLKNESEILAGVYYTSGKPSDASSSLYAGISVPLDPPVAVEDDEVVGPSFQIKDRNGKNVMVRFTRANLHYRTADKTWYIPEKQTDIVFNAGKAKYNAGYTTVESIDLFRWGATGFSDARREVYSPDIAYKANGTELTDNDLPYVSSDASSPNGNPIDMRDKKDQYVDWGWCYGYQQSGKKDYYFDDIYYTLSATEWKTVVDMYVYVCAKVKIASGEYVQGLLMLDCVDDAEALAILKKYNLISHDSDYIRITPSKLGSNQTAYKWNNVIVDDYSVLKEMNAVFFPKAGGNLPADNNSNKLTSTSINKLCYWLSSSPTTSSQKNANNLFIRLYEDARPPSFSISTTNGARERASSVRLVKVVETLEDDEIL